jgi:hypothetical protein
MEEVAASAQELARISDDLRHEVARFRTGDDAEGDAGPADAAAAPWREPARPRRMAAVA